MFVALEFKGPSQLLLVVIDELLSACQFFLKFLTHYNALGVLGLGLLPENFHLSLELRYHLLGLDRLPVHQFVQLVLKLLIVPFPLLKFTTQSHSKLLLLLDRFG